MILLYIVVTVLENKKMVSSESIEGFFLFLGCLMIFGTSFDVMPSRDCVICNWGNVAHLGEGFLLNLSVM